MTEAKIKELQLDVSELKLLQENATRNKVKDILSVQVRKLETDLVQLRDKAKAEEADKNGDVEKKATGGESARKILECQMKDYSWDQSEKFVKLYLTGLKGLDKCPNDNINITYSSESVNVRVGPLSDKENKVYVFSIKKTCHQINPEKSYHKAKSDYLLVFLAKHNPGSDWSHITYAEKAAADAKKKSDDASKVGDKEDPSASLMTMMKKMYDEGDDEMKRTIAKAWTEGQEKKNPMAPF